MIDLLLISTLLKEEEDYCYYYYYMHDYYNHCCYYYCYVGVSDRYIFEGLGHLVSTILINTAQYLKRINENGIKKM